MIIPNEYTGEETTKPVSAGELANEIWEYLFGVTRDAVPEALTDDVLKTIAELLLSGYHITRRQQQ